VRDNTSLHGGTNKKTSTSRRRFIKTTAGGAAGASAMLAGCSGGGSDETITIGDLSPRSGPNSLYGGPMHTSAQLAVEEMNEDDGLIGREVELVDPDPQSDVNTYQDQARRLILEDQVDVLMGGVTSASREAMRPTISENQQLYFYPALYEGGVCDEYIYLTGPTPEQQMLPLVEYMVNEFGTDVYTIAADYNFGQISARWTERYVQDMGGEIIGEEFIPLEVSDHGSTINRIQDADPDWIMSLIVGSNHVPFYSQAESSGLQKPMASTVSIGSAYEHITVDSPALENMHTAWNYMEELPSDANQEFVSRYRDEFPDTEYINQHGFSHYVSYKLYEMAVEEAGTTDMPEVNDVLESGVSISTAAGELTMDPATHHLNHNIHLARVEEDHSITFLDTTENVEPEWLRERCSLDTDSTWDDPTSEFFTDV
jgi:branched-chain amino acid transport system substrate-binding protein